MLEKARTLPADAVILHLEDGVPPGEKAAARLTVRQALAPGGYEPYTILRLNALGTGLTEADLTEAFVPGVDAICLAKARPQATCSAFLPSWQRLRRARDCLREMLPSA